MKQQYFTISELLAALGYPEGAKGRNALRQQIYRWCKTAPENRKDRPNASTRKAKLIEGIHWTAGNGARERLFTRAAVTAVKVLRDSAAIRTIDRNVRTLRKRGTREAQ